MHDFTFHNPTKIIFGRETENQIGSELKIHALNKVLFVYGRDSVKRSGLYDKVMKNLQDNRIDCVEHPGVSSNPVLSHAEKGIEIAKKENIDGILAVGGGSVIDETKAIAVGAKTNDKLWDFYTGKEVQDALPISAILTIAAAGSEMNGNSVLTNEKTKQKYSISSPYLYPKVSILNPSLTCTVPLDYTAYSAVDAITHVLEGYFTGSGTDLNNRLVESIVRTVIETTDLIMKQPDNYEARAEFMWAATLALNGLTPTGIGEFGFPNHMIEHSLSAIYNIPHGAGLSIVLPAWMKWYESHNPKKFIRFAQKVFGKKTGKEGVEALEHWFASIHSPTRLANVEIPKEDIEMITENAHGVACIWGIDKTYSKEIIVEILNNAQ